MVKGSIAELEMLRDAGCDSIDSCAPVWRGMCGRRLGELWGEIPINYNDDSEISVASDKLVLDNLEAVGVNTSAVRSR
jgi:hypothetical protein